MSKNAEVGVVVGVIIPIIIFAMLKKLPLGGEIKTLFNNLKHWFPCIAVGFMSYKYKWLEKIDRCLDDLRQMPASKVVDLIYPKENLRHKDIPLPDFGKIHEQMVQMGKHADLSFLWIDYKKEHPNGYQLAQFYKLYRDFMVDTYGTSKTSMPVERIPGEKMFIDWVGDQPELLLDTTTGELQKVHIFTTTLGFSSLVYAEIFPDGYAIRKCYLYVVSGRQRSRCSG